MDLTFTVRLTDLSDGTDPNLVHEQLSATIVGMVNRYTHTGESVLIRLEEVDPDIDVTVSRSAGADGARLVMIDTTFEPDASDGSSGLRVLVNDEPVYAGVTYAGVEQQIPDWDSED